MGCSTNCILLDMKPLKYVVIVSSKLISSMRAGNMQAYHTVCGYS